MASVDHSVPTPHDTSHCIGQCNITTHTWLHRAGFQGASGHHRDPASVHFALEVRLRCVLHRLHELTNQNLALLNRGATIRADTIEFQLAQLRVLTSQLPDDQARLFRKLHHNYSHTFWTQIEADLKTARNLNDNDIGEKMRALERVTEAQDAFLPRVKSAVKAVLCRVTGDPQISYQDTLEARRKLLSLDPSESNRTIESWIRRAGFRVPEYNKNEPLAKHIDPILTTLRNFNERRLNVLRRSLQNQFDQGLNLHEEVTTRFAQLSPNLKATYRREVEGLKSKLLALQGRTMLWMVDLPQQTPRIVRNWRDLNALFKNAIHNLHRIARETLPRDNPLPRAQ